MKRSEMLLNIQLERSCEIEEAESILNMVEKFGMVPPIIESESWKILESGEMTYAVHEWEKE